MYCGKCGKQIKENSKYCPYCGDKNMVQRSETVWDKKSAYLAGTYNVRVIFGSIALVLVVVLMFQFCSCCIEGLEANMDAFDWLNNSAKTMGLILHYIIPFAVSAICIEYIFKCIALKMNVDSIVCTRAGINLFICGIILWLGCTVFNDWSSRNDMITAYYRVFSNYRELVSMTIVFSITIFVCGLLIGKKN